MTAKGESIEQRFRTRGLNVGAADETAAGDVAVRADPVAVVVLVTEAVPVAEAIAADLVDLRAAEIAERVQDVVRKIGVDLMTAGPQVQGKDQEGQELIGHVHRIQPTEEMLLRGSGVFLIVAPEIEDQVGETAAVDLKADARDGVTIADQAIGQMIVELLTDEAAINEAAQAAAGFH